MDPFASALEQSAAVRRRDVSALELVNMYLDRIERHNATLNAFWVLSGELARDQATLFPCGGGGAAGAGGGRTVGEAARPLAGAATTVKDVVPMTGFPLTFGARAFEHNVASVDGFVVGKIREAGCPILGRTTMPELGTRPVTEFGLHGATRNPWDLSRTAGGSSGGAAAALAGGLCAWSHGSDGGGSVRVPAACCGLVGLKPSRGRISMGPLRGDGWAGLVTPGVLTRTVEDAGAALDALGGHLPGDPYWADPDGSYLEAACGRPRGLRVGVQVEAPGGVHPDVVDVVCRAGGALEACGCQVEMMGPDTRPFGDAVLTTVAAGVASYDLPPNSMHDLLNEAMVKRAARISAAGYVRAVDAIRAHSRAVVAFWEDHDVLLTPTLTHPAFEVGHFRGDPEEAMHEALDWLHFTHPYNCTGQPAISLPLGATGEGLPLGVQVVGAPRGEAAMLGAAAVLQECMPWRHRRPAGFSQ
jgi:Asp-tRNA(Asn)/Glu-tRNA(Gln) amidotransferase A subunit family amidase